MGNSRIVRLAALLTANAALALGPWFVRSADTGPVSAGFWRLALALPAIAVLARVSGQRIGGVARPAMLAILAGAMFFALDRASWHLGSERTRLGNATLFGNAGSLIVMAWGLVALRRAPRFAEWAAMGCAVAGAALLLGRSLEIGPRTLSGDLFCLLAGTLYAGYILLLRRARGTLGNWTALFWSSLFGLPVLLAVALLRGEPVWPHNWAVVAGLALSSQIIGQGLLVWSLRHFPPLVIGLALLTQPVVAVVVGWLAFGEMVGWLDLAGMGLVGAALVLSRTADTPDEPEVAKASEAR